MGGFFGLFDYNKPGPGVPKDAPPKPGVIVFFEIFFRKFWNLVKLNLLFFVFNLPAFLLAAFLIIFSQMIITERIGNDIFLDFSFRFVIAAFLLCVPVITFGPAQAGFTYVLRNYAREEHAFIWEDFKEHSLKNFKEGMIISCIDFAVVALILFDMYVYFSLDRNNILVSAASVLIFISLVIYYLMHLYIYPMLVSFQLSIKQIYKNALIFSIINLIPNLGIAMINIVLVFITFYLPMTGFLLFPVITMSTVGLITNFYVYPQLKKHMFDKLENLETQQ